MVRQEIDPPALLVNGQGDIARDSGDLVQGPGAAGRLQAVPDDRPGLAKIYRRRVQGVIRFATPQQPHAHADRRHAERLHARLLIQKSSSAAGLVSHPPPDTTKWAAEPFGIQTVALSTSIPGPPPSRRQPGAFNPKTATS